MSTTKDFPRLPVPNLTASLDKYLASLLPIFTQDEEDGGETVVKAMDRQRRLAEEFAGGVGRKLQRRLIDLDKNSPYNWLDDNFWARKMYLENRLPLPITSNVWLLLKDDPLIPEDAGTAQGIFSEWQIRRAAFIAWQYGTAKNQLESFTYEFDPEIFGPPNQKHKIGLSHFCRIPGIGCDSVNYPTEPNNPHRHKIVVLVNNWVYALEVIDSQGEVVSAPEILRRFQAIVRDVEQRKTRGEKAIPVSVLTADGRDNWAKNRQHLVDLSAHNVDVLSLIESSIVIISLDAISFENFDDHIRNVACGGTTGFNRWFDKAVTVSIENDGRAGIGMEHSALDGLVPGMILDHLMGQGMTMEVFEGREESLVKERGWGRFDWVLDEQTTREVEHVSKETADFLSGSELSALFFKEYGKAWIRDVAKCSPSAYIQLAFQLAWYKDQGSMTPVYIPASTHRFIHGRTDIIRAFSSESRAWLKAMNNPGESIVKKRKLLEKACDAHSKSDKDASRGLAFDRHLQGLMWLLGDDEPMPELFAEDIFWRSSEWKLCISTVGESRHRVAGFGAIHPEGYGIAYLLGSDELKIGLETKKSCLTTSVVRLKHLIVENLREMRDLFDEVSNVEARL